MRSSGSSSAATAGGGTARGERTQALGTDYDPGTGNSAPPSLLHVHATRGRLTALREDLRHHRGMSDSSSPARDRRLQ